MIDTTTEPEGSTNGGTIADEPTTPEPETTTDPSLESTTMDDTAEKESTPEPESSTIGGN